MIQTLIGIIIGGLVTALVARHYFTRGRRKRLSAYVVLSSNVFGGIDKDDRAKLRFEYQGKEIPDLYQKEFLIGNDGEIAISDCIEPLTLHLPKNVELLDASITFRSPGSLDVKVNRKEADLQSPPIVEFLFPLLNRGEFFIVKLLLDRKIKQTDCRFTILGDDLPREFKSEWLPREGTREDRISLKRTGLVFSLCSLVVGGLFGFMLYLLVHHRPELFLFPTHTFKPCFVSLVVVPLAAIISLAFFLFGLLLLIAIILHPLLSRRPPYSIPEEIVSRSVNFNFTTMRRLRGQKIYRIVSPTRDDGGDKI